jgi:hypothetical protein
MQRSYDFFWRRYCTTWADRGKLIFKTIRRAAGALGVHCETRCIRRYFAPVFRVIVSR